MLNKIIKNLENLNEAKGNCKYKEQIIKEATEMYNAGWTALEDGIVINIKDNQVIIKKGNFAVNNAMADFNVNMGVLNGNIDHEISCKEIPETKKNMYLAQAIITKYYTIKRA